MSHVDRAYRPDIDGLRAIAVGAVLVYHAFPSRLAGGFVGVDVFFVISGYLISGIILDALLDRRFTFANFYARRIRRIFPALVIVFAAVMAAGWQLLYADDYARTARHAAAGAAFVSNFVLWQESSYFDVAADLKPLLHLWSLAIEEQFYLVWPLLLVVVSRWKRGALMAILLIGSISFALAIWTVRIDPTPAFFAPWTRFWELLAGALLAAIERDTRLDSWLQRTLTVSIRHPLSVVGMAMILAGVILIDSTRVFPGLWVLLPVAGTAFLIASGSDAVINRTLLSWRIVVWVGLISYPLYLWHWPLLSFAQISHGAMPPASVRAGLLAVSVVLAAATYHLVERPIRFGVHRRGTVATLVTAMSALCAAALYVVSSGGLIDRPVNRSDAASLVDYYERLRKTGLAAAYRRECDFMDWQTEQARDTVDASCTAPGSTHTVLLWGDSFAQSLSLGLRESLPAGTALAQVATSACRAQTEDFDRRPDQRCEKANRYAIAAIERLHPDVVVIAQSGGHHGTDWAQFADRVLALGARHVIIVGPFPRWQPGLPRIYGERHLEDHADYVGTEFAGADRAVDRTLANGIAGRRNVTYLSLLDHLCRESACLARVPGEGPLDLMVLDAAHLTPKGSAYLGRLIWREMLAPLLR